MTFPIAIVNEWKASCFFSFEANGYTCYFYKILFICSYFSVYFNVAQYPLHHVTYSTTKFEVATSNGLEGDTFTRNRTDIQTTDRL